jgi:hypothetical protein
MSDHVVGPELSVDPSSAFAEGNKRAASSIGVAGRGEYYLTDDTLLLHVDRKASVVASDARKMVEAFAAARAALKNPGLQGVLLLARGQKMCSRTDTPARARPTLEAGNVAVYRLR